MYEELIQIEWGDCDEAGVVFYPNYFYWFDSAYHRFTRTLGLDQRTLRRRFGGVTPLIDVGARFLAPATYGDSLKITVAVVEWGENRFKIQYIGSSFWQKNLQKATRFLSLGVSNRGRRVARRGDPTRVSRCTDRRGALTGRAAYL